MEAAVIPIPSWIRAVAYSSILLVPFRYLQLPIMERAFSVQSVVEIAVMVALIHLVAISRLRIGTTFITLAFFIGLRFVCGLIESAGWFGLIWQSTRSMSQLLLWALLLSTVMRNDRLRENCIACYLFGIATAAALHALHIGVDSSIDLQNERSTAFSMNANELGTIYASAFVIAALALIDNRRVFVRSRWDLVLVLAVGSIVVVGISLTESRSALVFAGVALLASTLVRLRHGWSETRKIVIALVLACATWVLVSGISSVGARFDPMMQGRIDDEARVRMAPVLVGQFLGSPLWGIGPENYRTALTAVSGPNEGPNGKTSHNQVLMFASEMGMLGLVPFGLAMWMLARGSWRAHRQGETLPLALISAALFTALVTGNIMTHSHFYFAIALVTSMTPLALRSPAIRAPALRGAQ